MSFAMPAYLVPDFTLPSFVAAPDARWMPAPLDGVAPDNYHVTSMFPEYVRIDGSWQLISRMRMDACVVRESDGTLNAIEMRALLAGTPVLVGRSEDGSEGIFVHDAAFQEQGERRDAFVFRAGRSRETSFACDYDRLYELLRHEREHGNVLWVGGPAVTFDADSRAGMQALIEHGYVNGLMAGNALATHDLEASVFHTALGQDIYTQKSVVGGHCHHMDVINGVRKAGSIAAFVREQNITDGIMAALVASDTPYVLAGSIRDDGPLPDTIADVYAAQTAMRSLIERATTIICMATMLHTIATGNMAPSYHVDADGSVRPVFLYAVDASEFVVNKLHDRGSLSATTIVTNVQDFVFNVARGLGIAG